MALMTKKVQAAMLSDLTAFETTKDGYLGLCGYLVERHGQRHVAEFLVLLEPELGISPHRLLGNLRPLVILRAVQRLQDHRIVVSDEVLDYLKDRLINEVRTDPLRGVYETLERFWGSTFSFLVEGGRYAHR